MHVDNKLLVIVKNKEEDDVEDRYGYFGVVDPDLENLSSGFIARDMGNLYLTVDDLGEDGEDTIGILSKNGWFEGDCGTWVVEQKVPLILFYNNKV